MNPPPSSAAFHFKFQSFRLMRVFPEKLNRRFPHGSLASPPKLESSRISFVTPCMVRSPMMTKCFGSLPSMRLLRKVMVGYFSTSKKLGLRRSASRGGTPVWTLAASRTTSTFAELGSSFSSASIQPSLTLMVPRTFDIMWRMAKLVVLCDGSSAHFTIASSFSAGGPAYRNARRLARPFHDLILLLGGGTAYR